MSLVDIARRAVVEGRLRPAECNRSESQWREIGGWFLDSKGNRLFSDDQMKPSPSNVQSIVSWDDFSRDTAVLAGKIKLRHNRLAGVIGCPRSGVRAAADIAIRLGVPLFSFDKSRKLVELGSGIRLSTKTFDGELIIVDDSSFTGRSIEEARRLAPIASAWYAVYATSASARNLDAYARVLESHFFDWHVFHCHDLMRERSMGFDWDGVFNPDCTHAQDDDGEKYLDWMVNVHPIRFPDWIPTIITARREAYRSVCENWLERWGIQCDRLIMFEGSFHDRSRTWIGEWKSEKIKEAGIDLFVESDMQQAKDISSCLGGRQVLTTCA